MKGYKCVMLDWQRVTIDCGLWEECGEDHQEAKCEMIGGGGMEADQGDNRFAICVYMYVQYMCVGMCVGGDGCGCGCGCMCGCRWVYVWVF